MVGIHLTDVPFWHIFQRPSDLTQDEQKFLERNKRWQKEGGAYAMIRKEPGRAPPRLASRIHLQGLPPGSSRSSRSGAIVATISRAATRRTNCCERAISNLPEAFRPVFVLREIEGLSVEETADALQIPTGTVKTRLLRSRHILQRELDPEIRDALRDTFPFAGRDCDALTERVLANFLSGQDRGIVRDE